MVALVALIGATAALAWSDSYVNNQTFYPGDDDHSGFNSGLDGNALTFDNRFGGNPNLGSRYINPSGNGLNSFIWSTSSFVDFRTVSYGAAQCRANTANNYPVYVTQCYTDN